MSTKLSESCPHCTHANLPTDKAIALEERWGTFPAKFWRYVCERCGWVWANEAQRRHNEQAYRSARRRSKERGAGTFGG